MNSFLTRFLLSFACLLLVTNQLSCAQAPNWQQVITAGLGGTSHVTDIAADATGNLYITGYFSGSVSFGNATLSSAGGTDIFIAKYRNGNFVWAQRAGGTGADIAEAISVNGSNIYIDGFFSNTTVIGNASFVSNGGNDVFIAKLNDAGPSANFVWVQTLGGSRNDYTYALATSGSNVYVTGNFSSPILNIGNTTLALANATNPDGSSDIFVTKLTDNGATASFAWSQRAGGVGGEEVQAIAVAGTNVYLAGSFFSVTSPFGNTTLANIDPTGDTNDMFLAKLTDATNSASFTWAQRVGGTGADYAHDLAVSGNTIYLMGEFGSATLAFGSVILTNAAAAGGSTDIVVGKLTDTGANVAFGWAQRAGGTDYDIAFAMVLQGTDLYLGGMFFDPITFGPVTLTSTGDDDVFLAKLTDNGNEAAFKWGQRAGGADVDEASAVAVNGTSIYLGGAVMPPTAFGSLTVPSSTGNHFTGFVAGLSDNAPLATSNALATVVPELYPNPAHTKTTIYLPTVPGTSRVALTLRNALGQAVWKTQAALPATGLICELEVAGLPSGIYILHIQIGETLVVHRLVVE